MALINCSECNREVSSKAMSCPHCGNPIGATQGAVTKFVATPKLPVDLAVSGTILMWMSSPNVKGVVSNASEIPGLPRGRQLYLERKKTGLVVFCNPDFFAHIHYSQVALVEFVETAKVRQESKSVLGRAAVGAVLLGPFGAVLGGMSGMSTKNTPVNGLSITYWDVNSAQYRALMVESEAEHLGSFGSAVVDASKQYKTLHGAYCQ